MRNLVFILAIGLLCQSAFGANRWVSPNGSGDGTAENVPTGNIAQAVQGAANDIVYFLPGEYQFETVTITNDVTLISTEVLGAKMTFAYAQSIFEVESGHVNIDNFLFEFGALKVASGASLNISNAFFDDTVVFSYGTLYLSDSQFTGSNTIVNVYEESTAIIQNNIFHTESEVISTDGITEIYDNSFIETSIYARTSSSVHLKGNRYFGEGHFVDCASSITNEGDVLCGVRNTSAGGKHCSSTITENFTISYNDGCGICGSRENANKDCNGICFGPNTDCVAPKDIFVSTNGNGNGTILNPMGFEDALNTAQYNDTIRLFPGTYKNLNINLNGTAFTVTSYKDDPTSVIIQDSTINVVDASFDLIFRGITFTGDTFFDVADLMGVKIENCVFRNIETDPTLKGGYIWVVDSLFEDNIFYLLSNHGRNTKVAYFRVENIVTKNNTNSAIYAGFSTVVEVEKWVSVDNEGSVDAPADIFLNGFSANDLHYRLSVNDFSSSRPRTTGSYSSIECAGRTHSGLQQLDFNNISFCDTGPANFSSCLTFDDSDATTSGQIDGCGICQGDGTTHTDCLGECFGHRTLDLNGTCCLNSFKDCAGACNGTARIDRYGECCNGTLDCFGECDGEGAEDDYGECCLNYFIDCFGECYGEGAEDENGTCCVNNDFIDCAGFCNGTSSEDKNGTCCLDTLFDCAEICNGTSLEDENGKCCLEERLNCGLCDFNGTCETSDSSTEDTDEPTNDPTDSSDLTNDPTSEPTSASDPTNGSTKSSTDSSESDSTNTLNPIQSPSKTEKEDYTYVIVGSVAGFVILALALIVCVACLLSRSRKSHKEPPVPDSVEMAPTRNLDEWSDVSSDSDSSSG